MLGYGLFDGAEGGGGGGDSVHRGWAAKLKDQLPLGDGFRLGEEGLPLPLVVDGGEAISGSRSRGCCCWASGRCGLLCSSLGLLRCGMLSLGLRGWYGRASGSRSRSKSRSRGTASSESNDLCSQGRDLLLQCGDGLLVLAWGRSRCWNGGRVDFIFGGFELFKAQVEDWKSSMRCSAWARRY
jgi:hypothetical protein